MAFTRERTVVIVRDPTIDERTTARGLAKTAVPVDLRDALDGIELRAFQDQARLPSKHEVSSAPNIQTLRTFLTTREAAAYCGFATTGALRKARLEGRIVPIGRRGGRGTLMWSLDDLGRFLRGDVPVEKENGTLRCASFFWRST
jgi:hypothetical protein